MRGLGAAPAVVLLGLLAACGGTSSAPGADTRLTPPAVTASETATVAPVDWVASRAANVLGVCDHAQSAFRDGTLSPKDQYAGIASELQGMVDVADPAAGRILEPVIVAAGDLSVGAGHESTFNREYRRLQRTCVAAGSTIWDN